MTTPHVITPHVTTPHVTTPHVTIPQDESPRAAWGGAEEPQQPQKPQQGQPQQQESPQYSIIFKGGDDLRQDQLVVQMLILMDKLLQV